MKRGNRRQMPVIRSLNEANPRTLPKLIQRPKPHLPPAIRYGQLWKRHFDNANDWQPVALG
jgi:hypothetical protein